MSRIARLAALTLLLGSAGGALAACQAIAGIEDRTYVGDETTITATAQECEEYCTKTTEVCGDLLYRTPDACRSTCALFPSKGVAKNSVACRMGELSNFLSTGEDQELYCANAGPGGNDACGSNCENYCQLLSLTCTAQFKKYEDIAANSAAEDDTGTSICLSNCKALVDTHLYDATDQGNYLGDTLQCRLVHTTSATIDALGHCEHADLKSNKCVDDPPDCKTFCHVEMAVCSQFPMYESEEQCLDVCQALVPGQPIDIEHNTVACRTYHSYNSMIDAKTHCKHTGPGGDGHCTTEHDDPAKTGNCESYCRLLSTACKADFDEKFAKQAECEADCGELDGAANDSGYALSAKGNNVQCRLLHVSRALSNSDECGAALGAAPCK